MCEPSLRATIIGAVGSTAASIPIHVSSEACYESGSAFWPIFQAFLGAGPFRLRNYPTSFEHNLRFTACFVVYLGHHGIVSSNGVSISPQNVCLPGVLSVLKWGASEKNRCNPTVSRVFRVFSQPQKTLCLATPCRQPQQAVVIPA